MTATRPPSLSTESFAEASSIPLGDRYASIAETPPGRVDGRDREAPSSQSIDRLPSNGTAGPPELLGRGLHMPPEMLGMTGSESPTKESLPTSGKPRWPNVRTKKAGKREKAIKSTQSADAIAAAVRSASTPELSSRQVAIESTLFTLLTYGGVETIRLTSAAPVVSITSNSSSGMLVIAHQDGTIQTCCPAPTSREEGNPVTQSQSSVPQTSFGKYLWFNSLTLDAAKTFYQSDEKPCFCDRRAGISGQLVDVSSSMDNKLLIAHRKQLAVYEAAEEQEASKHLAVPKGTAGKLLWTTVLPSNIVTAKISGDGQAIVVVLDGDEEDDGSFVARTFIHDTEDGSVHDEIVGSPPHLERRNSVGMVFKPGPFLKHGAPITRVSFRGLGRNTSSNWTHGDEGNDLLLTFCGTDSSIRIFNQNGWKQLTMWTAPTNSRADWIRGSSAFSLGDLELYQKPKAAGSRAASRRPSASSDLSPVSGTNLGIRNATALGGVSPTTAAGAWIAEITFRGAFPALRLSRLSYMKRGNDDSQPAHFESIAAMLPPGSVVAASVIDADDMGLAIQGIWPAWNPWLSESSRGQNIDQSPGSAMQFLGLSSVPPSNNRFFGDSYLGGTHSPPTELRIAASHPKTGNLVLMEFPLWGDDDFGAMELGSPLRSVLSLSGMPSLERATDDERSIPGDSIDYDSTSRLSAQIDEDQKSISLYWKKKGIPASHSAELLKGDHLIDSDLTVKSTPIWIEDMSAFRVPLALPPILLPNGSMSKERIVAVKWFGDKNFDGAPLLLALTQSSTLVIYEIPPPESVREPIMPNFDPLSMSSHESVDDFYDEISGSDEEDEFDEQREEYEVSVTPHPDFGLGLRLESPMDGLPAVAGSFKKHPLNGGMLPAEKTKMIVLGDEVVSVNGVSLEHLTFDDIIATVRHVGAKTGPGQPLILHFRPAKPDRARRNSAVVQQSFTVRPLDSVDTPLPESIVSRRSVIGVSPKAHAKRSAGHRRQRSGGSIASPSSDSCGQFQLEFGRVVAVIHEAFPLEEGSGWPCSDKWLVLPWAEELESFVHPSEKDGALIIFADSKTIHAKRLDLPGHDNPDKIKVIPLGSIAIDGRGETEEAPGEIKSIQVVPSCGETRYFSVEDSLGQITLLGGEIKYETKEGGKFDWNLHFRKYRIFRCTVSGIENFSLRSASIDLFASYSNDRNFGNRAIVKVWAARYDPGFHGTTTEGVPIKDEYFGMDFMSEDIEVVNSNSSCADIVDVLFLKTGYMESAPALVVCLRSEVVIYRRRAGHFSWDLVHRVGFPKIFTSDGSNYDSFLSRTSLEETFPHFLPLIQATLRSLDESLLLSDWHPESLLAHICTDKRGARFALSGYVKRVLVWLAEAVDTSSNDGDTTCVTAPLAVAPLGTVGGLQKLKPSKVSISDDSAVSSSSWEFYNPQSMPSSNQRQEHLKLDALIQFLSCPLNFQPIAKAPEKSREFKLAMSRQATPSNTSTAPDGAFPTLQFVTPAEARVLWAIANMVRHPPDYGKLDVTGQLALTTFLLHDLLGRSPSDLPSKEAPSAAYNSTVSSFFLRMKSSDNLQERRKVRPQSASSACVSALLSDCQGAIIDTLRSTSKNLSWSQVRGLRMPFWVRSEEKLRRLTEEVGQNLYRETRDILKAAVFFLAAGKFRTLQNLSAADGTESGKKFCKFLTSFDFSSDRGRAAAEKNAFSLLRKNKYDSAAAFFLLAQPPNLKSAVETIASKMEDLDLAFLVARLVGNAQRNSSSGKFGPSNYGQSISSMLGGGAGYAGTSFKEEERDEQAYKEWNPDLNRWATDFLAERVLSGSSEDTAFSALLHLWLGREEVAWRLLSGFVQCRDGLFVVSDSNIRRLSLPTEAAKRSLDPTVVMVNSFVDFTSGPILLKTMNVVARTRVAAAMLLSSTLYRMGIELAALQNLQLIHTEGDSSTAEEEGLNALHRNHSIPPDLSGAQRRPEVMVPYSTDALVGETSGSEFGSSIFASYEAAPAPKVRSAYSNESRHIGSSDNSNDEMKSSIFDSFEAAPSVKKNYPDANEISSAGGPPGGEMVSSIFDSFEAAPAPKKKSNLVDDVKAIRPGSVRTSDAMTSSIFDSFNAPTTTRRSPAISSVQSANTSKETEKAPSPKTIPAVNHAAKGVSVSGGSPDGEMNSSIFDAFEAPHIAKRKTTTSYLARPPLKVESSTETGPTEDSRSAREPGVLASRASNVSLEAQGKIPILWREWKNKTIHVCVARRFVREIATHVAPFHLDIYSVEFNHNGSALDSRPVPSIASRTLQTHAPGEGLLNGIKECLNSLSESSGLTTRIIVTEALQLLQCQIKFNRLCFVVLLYLSIDQTDAAEDIIRDSARFMIETCYSCSSLENEARSLVFTTLQRQMAAHGSWQLELCLWLHRCGVLPLSGLALNESICAVRIGMLTASWNNDFEVLETMIRQPPDCSTDDASGRQVWTSLKKISGPAVGEKKHGVGSGGWEFLVDCRRAEATEMLRSRATGCFIIRPHAEDHGVFTLSFKTNLKPSDESLRGVEEAKISYPSPKQVKRDDIVQHAIIRLSDSGFRCGSFGPFATLMKLLEAVSSSLPFKLRFDQPPMDGVIKEEGTKPSPNSAFFRKLALVERKQLVPERWHVAREGENDRDEATKNNPSTRKNEKITKEGEGKETTQRMRMFAFFCELMVLSEIRKQLSSVAAARYESSTLSEDSDGHSLGSGTGDNDIGDSEQDFVVASRILRPFLIWCRMMEMRVSFEIAPPSREMVTRAESLPVALDASEGAIEISAAITNDSKFQGGDGVIRKMIQPGSGVRFRTLRIGEGGDSAMIVLFSRNEAVEWLLNNYLEMSESEASNCLQTMENHRVIEQVDLKLLSPSSFKKSLSGGGDEYRGFDPEMEFKGIRYRLVDPWEVEPLDSREGETMGAALGRHRFFAFSLDRVAGACEAIYRYIGGFHLLELWAAAGGGVLLSKAIATVHPPWERDAGGDLQLHHGTVAEPVPYENSIRQHLYRNAVFGRLGLPQRFLGLIQVELLDLKNLTSPGGSLSLTVYSLLRLKRPRSTAPLTMKTRTLDSAATQPIKLGKATGPNAPASWGSLVRFRFPLPEDTSSDGRSHDVDREALFKGAPSVLQVAVYEKKFMSDTLLGGADVKLDGLHSGGQLEEWVPLRTDTHGINWFARLRLTLRFELMCLSLKTDQADQPGELAPSAGLKRIQQLSSVGGIQEDLRKSTSTPDLLSYFESMVY